MKYLKILVIVLIIGIGAFLIFDKKEVEAPKEIKKEVKKEPKEYRLSLIMCGDALIHSSLYKDAYKNGVYDFKDKLEFIKPIVQKYDLAFYNQETVLGGTAIGLSDYPTFNSPQEFGDAMLDAGFNIVNLATNHTLDRGETAALNSVNYFKDKDVLTAGSYSSFEDAGKINIKEKNHIKYALLSYTYGTNGIKVPEGKEYLVNLYSDEKAKEDILKIRDKVDLLLVSMHWGTEYKDEPTLKQKKEAAYLADLGADIIIGTHPHVIEPVTYIGDTLVIYSLGNFISAQKTNNDYNTMVELMTMVDIVKKDGKIRLENLNNELLYNYYSHWRNFKVIPFSLMNENYNPDYKRLYDKYSAVVKRYNPDIKISSV